MAAEKTQNLQDTFLNYVRKNKTPLTIFLINGVKLQGIVSWFDAGSTISAFCFAATATRSSSTSMPFPRSCRAALSISMTRMKAAPVDRAP
jgi:hypothetical protein